MMVQCVRCSLYVRDGVASCRNLPVFVERMTCCEMVHLHVNASQIHFVLNA